MIERLQERPAHHVVLAQIEAVGQVDSAVDVIIPAGAFIHRRRGRSVEERLRRADEAERVPFMVGRELEQDDLLGVRVSHDRVDALVEGDQIKFVIASIPPVYPIFIAHQRRVEQLIPSRANEDSLRATWGIPRTPRV